MLGGSVDAASRHGVRGWVHDPDYPHLPVSLLITADDQLVARVVANQHRPDVERAGFGHGRYGFEITINPPLLPSRSWLIRIRAEADGQEMPGSPLRIPASDEFDAAALAAAFGSPATLAELEDRIGFLTAERERLLQMRADLQSGRPARETPLPTQAPRRALVLDTHGLPDAARDGGSVALLSHIRSLQRLGYAVSFAAPQMADDPAAAALRQDGIIVCHAPWFQSIEEVMRREADRFDVVYLHRVTTAADYLGLTRRYQPRAHLIYSVADLHHLRMTRQAMVENRVELLAEGRRVKALEIWAAQAADAVITHSPVEAALLGQAAPGARVHVAAWSIPCRAPAGFARRSGMAFIGNFRHAPNLAAARLLRDAIVPALHAVEPGIACKLVGRDLPPDWAAGALEVVGAVPDMASVFGTVRLTIAPLRFGAGLKAKVMESLAAGVPCICSPVAAEGMDLAGAGLGELIVSDTEAAVAAIRRLHGDAAYNREVAKRGLAFARANFSETRLDAAMREVLEGAVCETGRR